MNNDWYVPYQGPPQGGQPKKKKKEKDFWTDQISTGGGIGGALAGGAAGAALGSVVPIVGTAIGGLAGAILGGAAGSGAGEYAENRVTGEKDRLKNVGQEALLGGVFAAPPLRAARGILGATKGMVSGTAKEGFERGFAKRGFGKLGQRAEQTGQQLLVSQANVPRGMARQLDIGETFSNLNRYGLKRLEDIAEVAPKITGENGLMSAGVRKAVGNTAGVDTAGFREVAESLIQDNGTLLQPHIQKNITNEITQVLKKTAGGARGSLNPLANSLDVFDAVKALERKGASFGRGKAVTMLTPDEQAAKSIYNGMAAELKDRLFGAQGIEDALPVIKESMAKQVDALAKGTGRPGLRKLAADIRGATDISQLRKLQSPFVRGGQVAAETALSQSTSGLTFAQGAKGLGRLGNPLQAGAVVMEGANAPVGSALIRGGQFLSGRSGRGSSDDLGRQIRQVAPGAIPATIWQGFGKNTVGSPSQEQPASLEEALMQQPEPDMEGMQEQDLQQEQTPYGRENLLYDISRDPENADKYYEYYEMMQEIYAPPESQLTVSQQTRAAAAQNALRDVPMLEEAIRSGKLGGLKALPGSSTQLGRSLLGTEDLDAAMFNIADNILRARSGAAAPEAEVRRFVETFLPGPLDSEEAKVSKLERAVRELQGYVNPQQGAGGTLEEVLMNMQGAY